MFFSPMFQSLCGHVEVVRVGERSLHARTSEAAKAFFLCPACSSTGLEARKPILCNGSRSVLQIRHCKGEDLQ